MLLRGAHAPRPAGWARGATGAAPLPAAARTHARRRAAWDWGLPRAQWGADVQFSPAKLSASAPAAEGLRALRLELGEAAAAAYTKPGQYIQARPAPDVKPGFFAIASPPGAPGGAVELLVKAAGPAAEGLCAAPPGAAVDVSAVMGKGFPVERIPPADFPNVYIFACGSGIAPIRALIESGALEPARRREVRLYYGTFSPDTTAFLDRIPAWEAAGVKVTLVHSDDTHATGCWVQEQFVADGGVPPGGGAAAIVCGQREMATAVGEIFAAAGVDAAHVLSNF